MSETWTSAERPPVKCIQLTLSHISRAGQSASALRRRELNIHCGFNGIEVAALAVGNDRSLLLFSYSQYVRVVTAVTAGVLAMLILLRLVLVSVA